MTTIYPPAPRNTPPPDSDTVSIPSPLKQEALIPPPILVRLMPLFMGVLMIFMMIMMFMMFSSMGGGGRGGMMMMRMMMFIPMMLMGALMGFMGMGRTSGGTAEVDSERDNYALALNEQRKLAHRQAEWVHTLTVTNYPNPKTLINLVGKHIDGPSMWQASPDDDVFDTAAPGSKLRTNPYKTFRVGDGIVPLEPELRHDEMEIVDNLEPVTAGMFQRFKETQAVVVNAPVGLNFTEAPVYALRGDPERCVSLTRAMVCSAAFNHVPGDVQLGVISDRAESEWGWMKWLPHVQDTDNWRGGSSPKLAWESIGHFFAAQGDNIQRRISKENTSPSHMLILIDLPDSEVAWPEGVPTEIPGITFLLVRHGIDRISDMENRWLIGEDGILRLPDPDILAFARADSMSRDEADRFARRMSRWVPPGFGELSGIEIREAVTTTNVQSMFDALGIHDIDEWDPQETWRKNAYTESFEAPIGNLWDSSKGEQGSRVPGLATLNIMEASRGGSGVHGAIQGMTGSGKSYLLKGIVACLCATYGPDKLNFILMDFKGGSTFFGFERLAHITANISDLKESAELVSRTVDVLRGELERRKELFAKYKTGDILDYRKRQRTDPDMPVLPDLVVLIDEFRAYMKDNKEALNTIFEIGAQGRSLGIHCIPCSQFIDQGLIGEFSQHISWAISLKVNNSQGANLLIGNNKPMDLTEGTGEAMLRKPVGGRSKIESFAGFDVGAPYVRKQRTEAQRKETQRKVQSALRAFTLLNADEDLISHRGDEEDQEMVIVEETSQTMLEVLLNRLSEYQDYQSLKLWQPPLNVPMSMVDTIEDLAVRPSHGLPIRLGDTDAPLIHARIPYLIDLTNGTGHTKIMGRPKSGRSTVIQTMVVSSMVRYQERISWYLIEYSGSKLTDVEGCPNVGGYASRMDTEGINRFFGEFQKIMDLRMRMLSKYKIDLESYLERKRNGLFTDPADRAAIAEDRYEHMVLVLDGYDIMCQDDDAWKLDKIQNLVNDGPSVGQHLVVTSVDNMGISTRVEPKFSNVVILRMDDISRAHNPRGAMRELLTNIPVKQPGRCVDVENELSALIMLPMSCEVPSNGINEAGQPTYDMHRSYSEEIKDTCRQLREAYPNSRAHKIAPAPENYDYEAMWRAFRPIAEIPRRPHKTIFPLGVSMTTVRLVPLPQQMTTSHAITLGDPGCGKTSFLRGMINSITRQFGPDKAKIFIIDTGWSLLEERTKLVEMGYMKNEYYAQSEEDAATILASVTDLIRKRSSGDLNSMTREYIDQRSWIKGPEIFLLIDDYHRVRPTSSYDQSNPYPILAEALKKNPLSGVHVMMTSQIAGTASLMMSDKLLKTLGELRVPVIIMSGSPSEGALWMRGPRPKIRRPGQAQVFDRGTEKSDDVQLAYAPPWN